MYERDAWCGGTAANDDTGEADTGDTGPIWGRSGLCLRTACFSDSSTSATSCVGRSGRLEGGGTIKSIRHETNKPLIKRASCFHSLSHITKHPLLEHLRIAHDDAMILTCRWRHRTARRETNWAADRCPRAAVPGMCSYLRSSSCLGWCVSCGGSKKKSMQKLANGSQRVRNRVIDTTQFRGLNSNMNWLVMWLCVFRQASNFFFDKKRVTATGLKREEVECNWCRFGNFVSRYF